MNGGPSRTPPVFKWFTPNVAEEDRFVPPDFNLGQFFYTRETAERLADAFDRYERPCCLCTPRLAAEWFKRNRVVRLLDYDERFRTLPGFRPFDLLKPEPVNEAFDVVIFDPIFVDAARLARAVRVVTATAPGADLFMTFPLDREAELLSAFSGFALQRTDFALACCNIKSEYQSLFALYGTRLLDGFPRPRGEGTP